MSEYNQGTVKWFDNKKGFGIIIDNDSGKDIFVHHTSIYGNQNKFISLQENEGVKYFITNKNNKICADNVKPIAENFLNEKKNNHRKHVKNTTDFSPSYDKPDMRIMIASDKNKYEKVVSTRDIILANGLFDDESWPKDIYSELKKEIDLTGINEDELWKSWHGDTHYIADDHLKWKSNCPTFLKIINKISDYFDMDIKATRLNHYKDSNEWKPFHHDAAAVKKDKAITQNFTVAVSFGLERDVAFQHAKNGTVISIPVSNGTVYVFSKDVNIIWKHGIRKMEQNKYMDKGRFSIIAWGWKDMME